MKKPIVITSLAMRFSESDGWTRELLEQYVTGKIHKRGYGPDEAEYPYYILDLSSHLCVTKLIADGHVGELLGKDRWHELANLTDEEILRERL